MKIYIDADAFPKVLKTYLLKKIHTYDIELVFVANQCLRLPDSEKISSLVAPSGADAADDLIVEVVQPGDLVITADIPLADRIVSKGAYGINPRGQLYTEDNIKERLAVRDALDEVRSAGVITGGPAGFGDKDRQNFINQIDRFLTKMARNLKV